MDLSKWSQFRVAANFNASVQEVYAAWATPAGIERWFLRSAVFVSPGGRTRGAEEYVQAGDRYTWLWHGYTDDVSEEKQVLAANGKDFLQFVFSDDTVVSVSIRAQEDFTLLELLQEKIKPDDDPERNLLVQCQVGWTFYLANLKSILEGGVDLRNKRVDVLTNFK